MPNLLHIEASPSGEVSHSTGIARELLDAYRDRLPASTVAAVDVWNLDLPAFDATMIAAKFAVLRTQDATTAQRDHWARAVAISQMFNQADSYVFSVPMWNFGIPYRLKHYIDVVTLPGQNWSWSKAEGYQPLLRNKRAVSIYCSAGDFASNPETSAVNADFQKCYMRQWLRFTGIDVVDEIVVAPTLTDPAHLSEIKESCRQKARAVALTL